MQTLQGSHATEAQLEPIFDLRFCVGLLRDSWRIVAGTALSGAILLLLASFLVRTTYKATAIVLPPDQGSNSLSMMSAAASSSNLPTSALAAFGMKKPIDLYVALMTTPAVEDPVIENFHLQALYKSRHFSQARKKFESHLLVKPDEKSGLITISVIDRDPNRAAQLANGIIASFDALSGHLAITDASRRRIFYDRQMDDTKRNLVAAEDALRDTIKRTGMVEPEGNARAMIAYQAQLRAQITAKSVEVQAMKSYLADENPKVQTAQRERGALEAQADRLNSAGVGDISDSKAMASEASLEYMRSLREVRYNEALFELLLKNLELAKLDEAREGNLVQVVDAAKLPDMKYAPHRSIFLAGGFLLGLLLSSAWVLAQQFFV